MHFFFVCTLIVASTPVTSEQALQDAGNQAMDHGDYRQAALAWDKLARQDPLQSDRGGVVYAAINAWKMDYDARGQAASLCSGVELTQWYFTNTGRFEPEIVDRYWAFAALKKRDGVTCRLRVTRGNQSSMPRLVQSTSPVPQSLKRDKPAASPRPFTITGALLTSVGVAGIAGMTGSLVAYAKRTQQLKAIGVHGAEAESVYHQGKLFEHWAIASGVTGGISLVTGVALLAVARARKLSVVPQLGGLSLRGRF